MPVNNYKSWTDESFATPVKMHPNSVFYATNDSRDLGWVLLETRRARSARTRLFLGARAQSETRTINHAPRTDSEALSRILSQNFTV